MSFFTRALPATALLFVSLPNFAPDIVQALFTPVLGRIRDTGAVRVTYRESSIPFLFYDANKKPIGYATDLCLCMVGKLRTDPKRPDLKIQYVIVTPSIRMPVVIKDKTDLECGSTTNSHKRREKMTFATPHCIADIRMLIKTSSGICK